MYDSIIVGAGTAGLTSAIYLRRASKNVLVLEAKSYGGQIVNTLNIENYPGFESISGYEYSTRIYNQAIKLGAKVLFEKVIDIKDYDSYKEVITNKNSYKCKTIILATGSDNRKLGIDENKFIGKGVSYCATCDGSFYKNKTVMVVGGGNAAFEEALYLSSLASKVYLVHRREEFKAEISNINKLKEKDNVEFILNSRVTKLNGKDNLESVEITNNNETETINVDGLFIAIGRIPENQNFGKLINLDDNGYIISDESCLTNVPGIFVSGDARTKKVRQLVTAASDGAVAASEVLKYINKA